jgi:hypothetical protein
MDDRMRSNNQIRLNHFLRITIIILQALLWITSLLAQSYVPVKNSAKIKVAPVVPFKAYAFDLHDVTLLDGSPFKNAMEPTSDRW